MYALSKLATDDQDFIQYLNTNGRGRNKLTSIIFGKALADLALMPTTALNIETNRVIGNYIKAEDANDSVRSYYRQTSEIAALSFLEKVNELAVIDAKSMMDYTYMFYVMRYNILYPPNYTIINSKEFAIAEFLNILRSVDKATLIEITDNYSDAAKIYNSVNKLLKNLNGEEHNV